MNILGAVLFLAFAGASSKWLENKATNLWKENRRKFATD